jgi:large subunit ribosomal protein L9
MQLILRENVDKLGKRGDIVEVRPGFARNFLLPRNLAMAVNDNNVRRMEKDKKVMAVKHAKEKEEGEALASQIEGMKFSFRRKVHGEELYGSVSAADVADALAAKGYPVERRRIQLDEPIKSLGEFPVTARLHPEVSATLTVTVEKEEE